MTESVDLGFGEGTNSPTLIANPQSSLDAEILKEVHKRYGLDYLEGTLINISDWAELKPVLFGDQSVQSRFNEGDVRNDWVGKSVSEQPLIIYPDMAPVMGYSYGDEVESLLSLDLEGGEPVLPRSIDIRSLIDQIADATDEGRRNLRNGPVSSYLSERKTIQNVLEFQAQQDVSVLLTPSVPITSMQDFQSRIDLVGNIFQTANAVVEGGLVSADTKLMHTVSLDPTIFRKPEDGDSTRGERLVETFEEADPSMVAIHIKDLDHEHRDRVKSLLNVLSHIRESLGVPVFLFNVDEFGLVSFPHGVVGISGPIASFPYPRYSGGNSAAHGKYYHYEDLFGYTRERLMDMTRPEYRFPCYCEVCNNFEIIPKVPKEEWNRFRRIHYLLVKDKEMKRISETDKVLTEALRDMLANSERSDLISYL